MSRLVNWLNEESTWKRWQLAVMAITVLALYDALRWSGL